MTKSIMDMAVLVGLSMSGIAGFAYAGLLEEVGKEISRKISPNSDTN